MLKKILQQTILFISQKEMAFFFAPPLMLFILESIYSI